MLSEILSVLCNAILLMFDVSMTTLKYGRTLVPLLTDLTLVLSGALFFTRLKRPLAEAELPEPGDCIAHRGAYLDAPENSLEAFQYCVERGCKYVEFDVRTSRDGHCVVWHDADVAGVSIADSDWADLKVLDTGRRTPTWGDAPIFLCQLEEAAEFLSSNGLRMIVDIKDMDPRTSSRVVCLFKERPELLATCLVTSFHPLVIYRVRRQEPRITAALSFQPRSMTISVYNAFGPIRYRYERRPFMYWSMRVLESLYAVSWSLGLPQAWVGCSMLLIHRDFVSPSEVARWARYRVAVWPANLPLDKLHAARSLRVAFLSDTLTNVS